MKGKIILLIEDNPSDVGLTERALRKAHILDDLVVASDGQEALDYLFGTGVYAGRDVSDVPMLTLLDMKLPLVSGLEVLRRIRADACTHRMPVVILTSSRQEQDVAVAYDLGVNSYIRKPVDFQQFAEVVQQLGWYWLVLNEQPPKTCSAEVARNTCANF
jgi:CheY-like chemotaxis protein